MNSIIITMLIGVVAGVIDIAPMLAMKLDKYSIVSAFVFYLVLPFVVLYTTLFGEMWWIKGGVMGILLALPVIIIVAKEDKKAIASMGIMSVVLGTIIGVAGHILIR